MCVWFYLYSARSYAYAFNFKLLFSLLFFRDAIPNTELTSEVTQKLKEYTQVNTKH